MDLDNMSQEDKDRLFREFLDKRADLFMQAHTITNPAELNELAEYFIWSIGDFIPEVLHTDERLLESVTNFLGSVLIPVDGQA